MVSWPASRAVSPPAAPPAHARPATSRRQGVGKVGCYANSTLAGAAVDPACLARAEASFDKAVVSAEATRGCTVVQDGAFVETQMDAFVTELVLHLLFPRRRLPGAVGRAGPDTVPGSEGYTQVSGAIEAIAGLIPLALLGSYPRARSDRPLTRWVASWPRWLLPAVTTSGCRRRLLAVARIIQ
jgi:hypothetical protein